MHKLGHEIQKGTFFHESHQKSYPGSEDSCGVVDSKEFEPLKSTSYMEAPLAYFRFGRIVRKKANSVGALLRSVHDFGCIVSI